VNVVEQRTHQAERVICGHCPACERVAVVFNNHEAWPVVRCECGWAGATTELDHKVRLENGGRIIDLYNPEPGFA
jgi:Zn ribbon nucleic-acid-binding protein